MPNYIFYDSEGKIYKKKSSLSSHIIEEGLIEGHERTVKVDDLNSITKFHKVKNNQVVEMTQKEKDALLAQEAQTTLDVKIAQIDNLDVTVKDVIIALVQRINVRIPSNPITKNEILQQIRDNR